MNPPDDHAIGPLARADGEPVFAEAWQAQVLAIADALAERGVFGRAEWSNTLGAELARRAAAGEPDTAATYYAGALSALEVLLAERGAVSGGSLGSRIEAWRRAYLNTPHGQPVELAVGSRPSA